MLVVARVAGGDLARPVERQAHALQLAAHGRDVRVGPFGRMAGILAGGVFCRHAEGVPAHGVEHIVALGAAIARHHVAHGVVAHMPHVDAPRRIGEHLQHVIFRALVVVAGQEGLPLLPDPLPLLFGFAGVIALGNHGPFIAKGRESAGREHDFPRLVNDFASL